MIRKLRNSIATPYGVLPLSLANPDSEGALALDSSQSVDGSYLPVSLPIEKVVPVMIAKLISLCSRDLSRCPIKLDQLDINSKKAWAEFVIHVYEHRADYGELYSHLFLGGHLATAPVTYDLRIDNPRDYLLPHSPRTASVLPFSGSYLFVGSPSVGKSYFINNVMKKQDASLVVVSFRERGDLSSLQLTQSGMFMLMHAALVLGRDIVIDSIYMETVFDNSAKMQTGISRGTFNDFATLSTYAKIANTAVVQVMTWPTSRIDVAMEILNMATATSDGLITRVKLSDGDRLALVSLHDKFDRAFVPISELGKADYDQGVDQFSFASDSMDQLTSDATSFSRVFRLLNTNNSYQTDTDLENSARLGVSVALDNETKVNDFGGF